MTPDDPSILIVDDEPDITRTFERILRTEGYSVMTAQNGPTALAILRDHPVDVILLDLAMPGMDGLAVLRAIRNLPMHTAVVVISAHIEPAGEAEAKRLGAVAVLSKPPNIGDLLRLCSELSHHSPRKAS